MNCMFRGAKSCKILRICNCENCKFAKTEEEFLQGQKKAEMILSRKGLKKTVVTFDNGETNIVTVEVI